jgi:hypothetical protein
VTAIDDEQRGCAQNRRTQPVSLTIGNYSAALPPGSFRKYSTGYVYQKTVNGIFLCVFIKFTSTPGAINYWPIDGAASSALPPAQCR